jgi:hypothetical protein
VLHPKDVSCPNASQSSEIPVTGACTIGLPFFDTFSGHFPYSLFEHFEDLFWYDRRSLQPVRDGAVRIVYEPLNLHIVLKDGYTHLRHRSTQWSFASRPLTTKEAITMFWTPIPKEEFIYALHERIIQYFPDFVLRMRVVGVDGALIPGSPKGVERIVAQWRTKQRRGWFDSTLSFVRFLIATYIHHHVNLIRVLTAMLR